MKIFEINSNKNSNLFSSRFELQPISSSLIHLQQSLHFSSLSLLKAGSYFELDWEPPVAATTRSKQVQLGSSWIAPSRLLWE